MPLSISDELLTTAETAQILGRPVGSVNRWAKEGRLRVAHKLPTKRGANLYRRADVDALKAELEGKSEAGAA